MKAFSELLSSARKGAQEMQTSVFSHFADSCTIVARARAVRMSPGATPEAQGARRSGRAEGTRRGLSARRNPRRGKRVNTSADSPLDFVVVDDRRRSQSCASRGIPYALCRTCGRRRLSRNFRNRCGIDHGNLPESRRRPRDHRSWRAPAKPGVTYCQTKSTKSQTLKRTP